MNFPDLFDWLERLDFLRGYPAAYVLLLAALVIAVFWDWRVNVLALSIQYVMAALLFVDVLQPRLAIVKLFVGLFICLILYVTARQTEWGQLPPDVADHEAIRYQQRRQVRFGRYLPSGSLPFRLFLGLLVALVILSLSQRPGYQLPAVPAAVNLAIYALTSMGLLTLSLTTEPLKAGIGLLMFMTGFELFYNSLEQSVTMLAFLAVANLIIALTVAYLAQARHALPALFD